jgi:hypothetical protein
MNKYLKIILSQYKARGSVEIFFAWVFLRIKKYFHIGFKVKRCNQGKEIDIVIPTISKDFETLVLLIESLKYLKHSVKNIYIISPANEKIVDFCKKNNLIYTRASELLGFDKKDIKYTVDGVDRSGWLFQQLLKLSADKLTESPDYLVIDSDTIFVNDNCFIENDKYLFFTSEEWHQPYFDTFYNIFGYKAPTKLSLTSHMMIFNHEKLREMKDELEKKHNAKWYEVYMSTISLYEQSCISDYDTYANWMLYNYPNQVEIIPLYNKGFSRQKLSNLADLAKKFSNLKSVSFHSYIDKIDP